METETTSETTEQEQSTEQVEEESATDEVTPDEGNQETDSEDELPDWAKKSLKKARDEAASYRTRAREAEDKLKNAKTPEEFEAAVADFARKNAELERSLLVSKVASQYGLPPELADVLKGEDEKALVAHAKTLSAFVPKEDEDKELHGGLTPGKSDDGFDPVAVAHAAKKRRY